MNTHIDQLKERKDEYDETIQALSRYMTASAEVDIYPHVELRWEKPWPGGGDGLTANWSVEGNRMAPKQSDEYETVVTITSDPAKFIALAIQQLVPEICVRAQQLAREDFEHKHAKLQKEALNAEAAAAMDRCAVEEFSLKETETE